MSNQVKLHNALAGQIVASIVRPPMEAGGSFEDVLILTESVILGVILTVVKLGGDEIVLDTVIERVKQRLAENRLKDIDTKGTA